MSLSGPGYASEHELRILYAGDELRILGDHMKAIRACMFGEPDPLVEQALAAVRARIMVAAIEYAQACEADAVHRAVEKAMAP